MDMQEEDLSLIPSGARDLVAHGDAQRNSMHCFTPRSFKMGKHKGSLYTRG